MVILLINPNRNRPAIPPIGLDYLYDVLRDTEHRVLFFDFGVQSPGELKELIQREHPDIIGITVRNLDNVTCIRKHEYVTPLNKLIATIRRISGSSIVLGGAGFSCMPYEVMTATGADFGIVGDGEIALPILLENLDEPENTPNLFYRDPSDNSVIRWTESHYPCLKDLPASRRALVDNESYNRLGNPGNIQTMRGCTHRCIYCLEPQLGGNRVRLRPCEKVIDELTMMVACGITDRIFVVDSEFNEVPDHAFLISEAIIRSGLKVKWLCTMTPRFVDGQLLKIMKRAGCELVVWSISTASEVMLDNLQKGFTVSDITRVSTECDRIGLRYCHSLLFGGPGESFATIDEGYSNLSRTGALALTVGAGIRIYPGTELSNIALGEGELSPDTDLLYPVYYREKEVLEEFLPHIKMRYQGLSSCLMPGVIPNKKVREEILRVFPAFI